MLLHSAFKIPCIHNTHTRVQDHAPGISGISASLNCSLFPAKGKPYDQVRIACSWVWFDALFLTITMCSTPGEFQHWEPSVRECRTSSQRSSILNFASLAFQGQGLLERGFPFCWVLSDSFMMSPSTGDGRILKILLSLLCYRISCSRVPAKPLEWCSRCGHSPACKAPPSAELCTWRHQPTHPGTWEALQGAPWEWQTQEELAAGRCWIYTILPVVQGSVLLFPETLLSIMLTL